MLFVGGAIGHASSSIRPGPYVTWAPRQTEVSQVTFAVSGHANSLGPVDTMRVIPAGAVLPPHHVRCVMATAVLPPASL